jgi:hypothetical protein
MAKKKKQNKNKGQRHTGLSAHQRQRTTLIPPLAKLPVQMVDFERDLLPEHLWLAGLVDLYTPQEAHLPFYEFMDAFDEFCPDESVALGFISDFGLIPADQRSAFVEQHRDLIRAAFVEPIGRILAFYPGHPAAWLVDAQTLAEDGPLDPDMELSRLRRLVIELLPAKDDHAGHIRALPFGRSLKHGKMAFAQDFPVLELLPRYPNNCNEEEKQRVQQFVRTAVNMQYQSEPRYADRAWPKYFWRHNYDLAICKPTYFPIGGSKQLTEEQATPISDILEANARRARGYLETLARRVRYDLFEPAKGEILSGLFARCLRLYVLMTEDANLWARDTSGIMLRCLADTAITFGYLAKCGTEEDYKKFREYGEGQEKLLMLHLQDNYPEEVSLEGRSSEAIADELGSFAPELMQIELGHWSKQDTRKLARKAGMEQLYRLVYSPASGDLHGSWMSLKQSNLCRCAEPLHRFHRLPTFAEPTVFLDSMVASQLLFERCVEIAVNVLGYPELEPPLSAIPSFEQEE